MLYGHLRTSHDTSDAGNSTPAQKAMKQTSKSESQPENESKDPVAAPHGAEDVSEGDKPIGASDNHGRSPYEEPNHLVRKQRQGE
ncbi:MAG: hypothetical protein EOO26_02290 [Comamonadaceae bacterium]|nr:MAG: hypothetical protein EOO26_02290 [Comamonadaceae bacterium]